MLQLPLKYNLMEVADVQLSVVAVLCRGSVCGARPAARAPSGSSRGHRAPWAGEGKLPGDLPQLLQGLWLRAASGWLLGQAGLGQESRLAAAAGACLAPKW